MPTKHKKRHFTEPLIHTAVAAVLGMGLTFILMLLGAWIILRGSVEEGGMKVWLFISVFCGSLCSSALTRNSFRGLVPGILASAVAYIMLLLLLSFSGQSSSIKDTLSMTMLVVICFGSAAGKVTILVKSNKSYIIKSKRKRAIT
ncbi:MAG: hypothetical protein E7442_00410 [Ruminococcaceae bacterium]|nr:hypothetical protein [Oscillospiraceae bacterium]